MKRNTLFLGIVISLLTLFLVACDQNTHYPPNAQASTTATATPAITPTPVTTPTSTPSPSVTSTPTTVQSIATATSYYQAVKVKNYDLAYSYLDAHATTTDGKKLTKSVFLQLAQEEEVNFGSINNVDFFPGSADGTQIIATIDRGGTPYHAHLTLKKEGNTWKITTLDRV